MKNIGFFLSENFQFLVVKFSVYLNRHIFVILRHCLFLISSSGASGRLCFVIVAVLYDCGIFLVFSFICCCFLSMSLVVLLFVTHLTSRRLCCMIVAFLGISTYRFMQGVCCAIISSSSLAGLGGSVGCAVRLETRRSRVQPPPRSATFFRGDWPWNIFYGHSLPSADSRRAVVSFWPKNVHNTG